MHYVEREAEKTAVRLAGEYPILAIVGPRQAGKTVLARATFPDKPYVSLEEPDTRQFALEDPRGFLAQFPDGAILDEVQRAPELFSYLQGLVDGDGRSGLFVLTASSQFNLLNSITQSLAGRVAILRLLSFSLGEMERAGIAPEELDELLFKGLYPPIYDRGADAHGWYGNYVATYIERDLRQMLNVRDLSAFTLFVRLLAGRTGQPLNLSGLALDAGVAPNTARAWLSVLEASLLIHLLPSHHRNFRKRLVKAPKVHFLDPGLAAWLLGIRSSREIALHPSRGALFESWAVAEFLKIRFNQGLEGNLFHWRDRSGHEVDLIVDRGTELLPVEVKAGRTVTSGFFAGLRYWRELAGLDAAAESWLIYGGEESQERSGVRVLPWRRVPELRP